MKYIIAPLLLGLATSPGLSAEPLQQMDVPAALFDFREVVKSATDKVFPAVVYIKCVRDTHELGKKVSQEAGGSGVIVSPSGELVTNWHVIEKAVEVRCLLFDGRAFPAIVVGSDKDTDLALIRLKRGSDSSPLPFATMGDSSRLKPGDFVMAMGAPWGLSRSVSIGIISCTNRFLPAASEYSLWLQTDAAISPGNSGGPLVNTNGEIIGINTRGIFFGGDLGFAVPSATVQRVAAQLRESGRVNWSWTGLQLQPLRDFDANVYFDGNEGVIVAETYPESPARQGGLRVRDRILSVNGKPVTAITTEDLPAIRCELGMLPKRVPATFEVLRDDQRLMIEVTPREKGDVEGNERDFPRWDFTAKTINEFDNPDLYFVRRQGVFVYGVKYPGNAANAGLQRSDILVKVGDQEINTLEQLVLAHKQALEKLSERNRMVFTVLRNGLMRQVVLDYSREFEKE